MRRSVVSVVTILAQGTASPSFSLSLDPGALDPRFVAGEGCVNVVVVARYGGRALTWGTTVWPGDTVVRVPTMDMSNAVVPPGSGGAATLGIEPQVAPCGSIVWGDYNGPYQTKIMDIMDPPAIEGWDA